MHLNSRNHADLRGGVMTLYNTAFVSELAKLPDELVFIASRGQSFRISRIGIQRVRIYHDGTHRLNDGEDDNDCDDEESVVRDCVVIEADEAGA